MTVTQDIPCSTSYKLIAIDLDGTLLGSDHKVSHENIKILEQVYKKGIRIAICTGRSTASALQVFEQNEFYKEENLKLDFVTFNGGYCTSYGKNISSSTSRSFVFCLPAPKNVLDQIIEFAIEHQLVLNIYIEDFIYSVCTKEEYYNLTQKYRSMTGANYCRVDSYSQLPKEKKVIKVIVLSIDPNKFYNELDLYFQNKGNKKQVHLIKGRYFVEVLHPEVNKGRGLVELCKYLDISIGEVVAFGDGTNDVEFLQSAGLGIAMANAEDSAKNAANIVSKYTNNQDAVAKELNSLLKLGKLKS